MIYKKIEIAVDGYKETADWKKDYIFLYGKYRICGIYCS